MAIAGADLAFVLWRLVHGRSNDAEIALAAVIGGVLLLRGSLVASKWVQRILTIIITMAIVAVVGLPFLYPPSYWFAEIEHLSTTGSATILASIIILGALIWIARQLNRPEVHAAQVARGIKPSKWWAAALFGVIIAAVILASIYPMFHSATSREAVRRAALQYGDSYDYVVTKLNVDFTGGHKNVSATLTAYNNDGLRPVTVSWREQP